MTLGSLFAGIGGFDLAATRVGWDVRWQVEIDPFARAVLEKHWPSVHRPSDVMKVHQYHGQDCGPCPECIWPVDVLAGGFPCQDLSSAGKRKGLDGERSGLWRQFMRVVDELQPKPRAIVIENVHHAWRQWVPILRRAMWQRGYASLPIRLQACDFGAWHERRRVFLVAHIDPSALRLESWRRGWPFRAYSPLFADVTEDGCGFPESAIGSECEAWRRPNVTGHARAQTADTHSSRCADGEGCGADAWEHGQRSVAADVDAMRQLQPERVEPNEWGWAGDSSRWATEPDVVRVVHGISSRLDGRRMAARIGALGNALIPDAAEWIFRQIQAHADALADTSNGDDFVGLGAVGQPEQR